LPDLRFDRGLLGRALAYELGLSRPSTLEPLRPGACLGPEDLDLAEHARILGRNAVLRLDPAQNVVQRAGAEQNLEGRVGAPGDVDRDQAVRQRGLRAAQVSLGDGETDAILGQVALDALQLDVGEVVGLDRAREARVERANLAEHTLSLRLLRGKRARLGRRGRRRKNCRDEGECDEPR
jgi:hypothetical protein